MALMLVLNGRATAQLLSEDLPANARGIDVEDKVGDFIPLDLIFADERGNKIGLGKYFNQGKTIVLTLNYSDCPGLCIAQLDNLVSTLREMNGDGLGEDYEIVTVSIDPKESPEKAARTKGKYVGLLRDSKAEEAWHFLTGKQAEISKLADAVGFRYSYDRANRRYNHPAAVFFVHPNGRLCRYLLSLGVEPEQFKLAVGEAQQGKLTFSVADAIIQFCYLYDPEANRYSASARRIMAFGGAAFVLMLSAGTAPFWFSSKKRKSTKVGSPATEQAEFAEQPTEAERTASAQAGAANEPHRLEK